MKSRLRRLEEDNLKKEKEIEQLLDPSKSDDMRRTLTDRKPDSSTVSTGLVYLELSCGTLILKLLIKPLISPFSGPLPVKRFSG